MLGIALKSFPELVRKINKVCDQRMCMCHQLLRKHMDKGVLLVINTLIVGEQHARVGRHPGDLKTVRIPTGSHVKFLKLCASISLFLYMFSF